MKLLSVFLYGFIHSRMIVSIHRKKLYNENLLNLTQFKITDNKIIIENIKTKREISFKKYQSIKVTLLKKINKLDSMLDINIMSIYN